MRTTLRFDPGGQIGCLYTEVIDLRELGKLEITRATDIRFNPAAQQWDVHSADTDRVLFSHASRSECLTWENQNLQPKPRQAQIEGGDGPLHAHPLGRRPPTPSPEPDPHAHPAHPRQKRSAAPRPAALLPTEKRTPIPTLSKERGHRLIGASPPEPAPAHHPQRLPGPRGPSARPRHGHTPAPPSQRLHALADASLCRAPPPAGGPCPRFWRVPDGRSVTAGPVDPSSRPRQAAARAGRNPA
jgi:hypothetical protein